VLFRYTNRDDIDFTNVEDFKPVLEFELLEDFTGEVEYKVR